MNKLNARQKIRMNPCWYCGQRGSTLDHQVSRHHGGSDDPSNLVSACRFCNLSKGTKTPDEFRPTAAMYVYAEFNRSLTRVYVQMLRLEGEFPDVFKPLLEDLRKHAESFKFAGEL